MLPLSKILIRAKEIVDSRDSEIIAQKIFGLSSAQIITQEEKKISQDLEEKFFRYIQKRADGKSISELFGEKFFWKQNFLVTNDVLTPRPETEFLVEWAVEKIFSLVQKGKKNFSVLDIGTGSGCIICSIADEIRIRDEKNFSSLEFFAGDISKDALKIAKKNAAQLGLEEKILFRTSDLLENFSAPEIQDSILITNLPYIPQGDEKIMEKEVLGGDPYLSLFSGEDGTDLYKKFFTQLPNTFHALAFEYDPPQTKFFEILLQEKFYDRNMKFFPDISREIRFGVIA